MKGKIYVIRSHQTTDIYIGSTTILLCNRLAKHKYEYKINQRYYTSYEIIKYNDAYIELLEEIECETKEQLRAKEGYYIRSMNCVNKKIDGRTKKQYYKDNIEHKKEIDKIYYENNKEEKKEYAKNYYEKNKEEILKKMKIYTEKNKEEKKEYAKKYNEENKEKIYKKCNCECGGKYIYRCKSQHLKSKKHIIFESHL
jgi:hypothetical protein